MSDTDRHCQSCQKWHSPHEDCEGEPLLKANDSDQRSCYASPTEVGFRLRWVRESQKLSFRNVSERSGVSIGIIHRVEQGKNVELRNFLKIIEALNVKIETVLSKSEA